MFFSWLCITLDGSFCRNLHSLLSNGQTRRILSTPSRSPIPPRHPLSRAPSNNSFTTTRNRRQCTICPELFARWQDRDRHKLQHLPYFMHCPLPHCPWRGNRAELFKKHWQQEDHRSYHEYYGHNPEGSQIETYNPRDVLNKIRCGAIPPCEGEDEAIILVQVKAYDLQKTSVWTDLWGRKKK